MKIHLFKLVSGEEIIAQLDSVDDSLDGLTYFINSPRKVENGHCRGRWITGLATDVTLLGVPMPRTMIMLVALEEDIMPSLVQEYKELTGLAPKTTRTPRTSGAAGITA